MTARQEGVLAPALKPFLTYSLALHFALALGALRLLGLAGTSVKNNVYTIDFVGGPAAVITSAGAPAAPAAPPAAAAQQAKPAPQAEFDEFGRRRGKHARFVLPRPSLLRGANARKTAALAPPAPSALSSDQAGAAASAAGPGAGGSGAGVSADMPNFPYPWYISRVRQMLWSQWQSRRVALPGECVIVFSLLRNGSVVDLRTESSSGDSAFDLAALAAVQDAAPYPPLPAGFKEPFLKVHVTLRS